jgi:hypothetical protein
MWEYFHAVFHWRDVSWSEALGDIPSTEEIYMTALCLYDIIQNRFLVKLNADSQLRFNRTSSTLLSKHYIRFTRQRTRGNRGRVGGGGKYRIIAFTSKNTTIYKCLDNKNISIRLEDSLLARDDASKTAGYTGCFTTLGHNCRRWFARSLWSKKFI